MEGSISGETNRCPPWLLLSHKDGPEEQCFYSLSEQICGTASIPQLVNKCVLGFGHGWLVLADHNTNYCCLWNPLSMPEMVELPRLDNSFIYNTCVLSKPPTDPDSCVLFISTRIMNHSFCRQAFCRIGDDMYFEQSLPLQAAIPFQGKMYGLMRFDLQLVTVHFDFIEGTLELRQILTEGGPWKIPDPFPGPILTEEGEDIEPWVEKYYLIESQSSCGTELLLVHEITPFSYDLEFRVFQVDFNRMECVELKLIGDRAIFLSFYGCGMCCSSEGSEGIEANSIYYTVKDSRLLNRYDMDVRGRALWEPCPDARVSRTITYWVEDQVFSSPTIRSTFSEIMIVEI